LQDYWLAQIGTPPNQRLQPTPLKRALRVDKVTLAGVQATLRIT